MKRILTVLVAMLIMAAMLVVMAVPAFAKIQQDADTRGGGGDPQGGGRGLIIDCENPSGKAPKGQNDPDKC